jgi:hypothetical protein
MLGGGMKIINITLKQLPFLGLLFTTGVAAAHAETVNCTPIKSLPAVISSQGVYCLTGNLTTNISSGIAINITANNVTLDLNGWKVGGQAAGTTTLAAGIFSDADNVTVKNGIVRGFNVGIYLQGRGSVVEDMLTDENTTVGIEVIGQGSIVRRNQVVDTGGSTLDPGSFAIGIEVDGSGASVEDNEVSGLTATYLSVNLITETGIEIIGDYSTARHNIITDNARPGGGSDSNGIDAGGHEVTIVDNVISNFNFGIIYTSNTGAGIYSRNTVVGCDTPFLGGTAGSGNDHD